MSKKNPLVFLDMSIDGDPLERMLFELFSDVVPKTAENFRALCTGEKGISPKCGKPLHYKGSFFHRIVKGSMAQGGDFFKRDGSYGESIYGGKFPDESPKLKHDGPGLLSMAIADRHSRGSLFTVTFNANHHLDRKYVVFGKLVQGHEVLKKIENAGDEEGRPAVTVKIVNSGEFHESENQRSDKSKPSKLKTRKDASFEVNSLQVRRKGKERRKKRRRDNSIESNSSSDSESSESDSSDINSSSDHRIEPGSWNAVNSEAQESSGINIRSTPISPKSNLKSNITVSKPFGLHSNNISCSIASVISPQKAYLRTLEKLLFVENVNTSSVHSSLFENVKHLNNTQLFEKPGIKRKLNLEDFERKKRRKTSRTSEGGCCKCKRSKCLKRYCECFAANLYCVKDCICQDCYNRPEYEDTVSEAKEQVESRNPLAFAEKIESGRHLTASSARQKWVCNCKKSMCSKKYCDCYKAGVGCSDGCRCEVCKNMHGTKEEYLARKHIVNTKAEGGKLEAACYEKLEMAMPGVDFSQNNLLDPQNLTSSRSPFQYSDHGEGASNAPSTYRGYPVQGYSHLTILDSYLLPQSNSDNHPMVLDNSKKIQDAITFQGQQNYEFSQRDITNDPESQLYHLSGQFYSPDSLNLINSTIPPENLFSGTKQNEPAEDQMPEILKEASTPENSGKVSSPNKKRVSPPNSRSIESGGSPSGSGSGRLRGGRKFLLQSVPPNPSSGPTDESTNDPQDYSSK